MFKNRIIDSIFEKMSILSEGIISISKDFDKLKSNDKYLEHQFKSLSFKVDKLQLEILNNNTNNAINKVNDALMEYIKNKSNNQPIVFDEKEDKCISDESNEHLLLNELDKYGIDIIVNDEEGNLSISFPSESYDKISFSKLSKRTTIKINKHKNY